MAGEHRKSEWAIDAGGRLGNMMGKEPGSVPGQLHMGNLGERRDVCTAYDDVQSRSPGARRSALRRRLAVERLVRIDGRPATRRAPPGALDGVMASAAPGVKIVVAAKEEASCDRV